MRIDARIGTFDRVGNGPRCAHAADGGLGDQDPCTREDLGDLARAHGRRGLGELPNDLRDEAREAIAIVLRTVTPIPDELRGRDLSFSLNVQWCNPRLSAAGVPLDDVARGAFENVRSHGPHLYRVPAALTGASELPLELSIPDTYSFCTAFPIAPELAMGDHGSASYRRVTLFNDVSSVATVTAGVLLGLAFLILSRASGRSAFGWAALAAFTSSSGALNILGFWQFFLGWQGDLASPLLALVTQYAFLRFAKDYLGAPFRLRAWGIFAIASALAVVLSARRYDLYSMFAVVSASLLVGFAFICWVLVRFGWRHRNGKLLAGALALSIIPIVVELLPAMGLPDFGRGAHTGPMGMIIALFGMLAAVTRDHLAATRDLEAQLAATEARGREVSTLNEELRRQIAERSRDLADALAGTLVADAETRGLVEGDVVEGRYRVVRELGEGGMGAVHEVERTNDGKHFALKSMTGRAEPRAAARFAREAELVATVHHPNLVDIVDFGLSRRGHLYLVMELVDGGSVEGSRERFGDVPWALSILEQIARGLAVLHARGVVHRDLKPANVLLHGGVAKIADFGISRRDEESGADPAGDTVAARQLTQTGSLVGTPLYMAPELAAPGAAVRPASDVFAFGIVAFELLTGRYPFASPPILAALAGAALDQRQLFLPASDNYFCRYAAVRTARAMVVARGAPARRRGSRSPGWSRTSRSA